MKRMRQPTTANTARAARPARRAGFSMIEVMLALMVVSVGILGILALFPMGLDQNRRGVAESYIALFADEVFSGLRALADDDWDALNSGALLPVAASPLTAIEGFEGVTNIAFSPGVQTNVYRASADQVIVNHVLRYRLALTSENRIKKVTLWVWSGQYGTTNNPDVYYSEYFNYRPQ